MSEQDTRTCESCGGPIEVIAKFRHEPQCPHDPQLLTTPAGEGRVEAIESIHKHLHPIRAAADCDTCWFIQQHTRLSERLRAVEAERDRAKWDVECWVKGQPTVDQLHAEARRRRESALLMEQEISQLKELVHILRGND